ncbi:hypothetical protein SSKA14_3297 [Stenotrophomonas sp. SKA14]|nr:hypothetical protein SSKA14_3297 [Stenotrophomonas sp. SKA14]
MEQHRGARSSWRCFRGGSPLPIPGGASGRPSTPLRGAIGTESPTRR